MIFVTVGTTIPFDSLIKSADRLAEKSEMEDEVVCQIGNGHYEPEHCRFFRFSTSIEDEVNQARLIITHGGTGTVLSLLQRQRPFVAVANPDAADDHQAEFLKRLSADFLIRWTADPDSIEEFILDGHPVPEYSPSSGLADAIVEFANLR